MTEALIEQLRRARGGYEEERVFHRFLHDAYSGGGGFQGDIRQPVSGFWGRAAEVYTSSVSAPDGDADSYLTRFPREDMPKYRGRVSIAHYKNYVDALTDTKVGYLLSKDPDRKLSDQVEAWREDADGKGTDFDAWRARCALRAAILGWVPVVIDLDGQTHDEEGLPVEMTRAQAQEMNLQPRLVPLFPANLLDYAVDETGDFVWAKIRTDSVEHEEWSAKPTQVERYTIWTKGGFVIYEVRKSDTTADSAMLVNQGEHPFGRVPVTILSHRELPEGGIGGLPMHGQVSIEARRLFNLESELDEHIRGQVFAILQVPTDSPESLGELKVGVDNALPVKPDSRQSYEYIAPPASVAATLEKRIEVTTRELYRMGRVEFTRPTAQATSAESRAFEFQQTNQAIQAFALVLCKWEQEVYDLVDAVEGGSGENTVTPPKSFDIDNLMRDLAEAMAGVEMELSPRATAEIKKRAVRRTLPDLEQPLLDEIDEQLEEAANREGLMAAMGAEMAQAAAAGQDDGDPGSAGDDAPDDDADDFPNQE